MRSSPPGAWRSDGTFYLVVDGDEEATLTRLVNQVCHSLKVLGFKGWGKPGRTWLPGVDPDPFGHDDE